MIILVSVIIDEMNREIPYIDVCSSSRKRYKVNKPFWNDELKGLWKNMNLHERKFRNFSKNKSILRQNIYLEFKTARILFDKRLRYHERKYNKGNLIIIEEACTSNHKDFWSYVKKLGPKKQKTIPEEVYDKEGNLFQSIGKHLGPVNALDISADRRFLATALEDSTVNLWYFDSIQGKFQWIRAEDFPI